MNEGYKISCIVVTAHRNSSFAQLTAYVCMIMCDQSKEVKKKVGMLLQ